jgi:hypothetical protein
MITNGLDSARASRPMTPVAKADKTAARLEIIEVPQFNLPEVAVRDIIARHVRMQRTEGALFRQPRQHQVLAEQPPLVGILERMPGRELGGAGLGRWLPVEQLDGPLRRFLLPRSQLRTRAWVVCDISFFDLGFGGRFVDDPDGH